MTTKLPQTAIDRAIGFLHHYLPANGDPVPSADAQAAAAAQVPPISARTLQRAANAIGADISSEPGPRGRTTTWARPVDPTPPAPEPAEPQPPPEQNAPTVRHGTLGARARLVLNQPLPRTKGSRR
jgi:hypothetical protein